MNTEKPYQVQFHDNVMQLCALITRNVEQFAASGYNIVSPDKIKLVTAIISVYNKDHLIQGFINNSHERCWDEIFNKNEEFLINNSEEIFKFLPAKDPKGQITIFKQLYTAKDNQGKNLVNDNMKQQLWILLGQLIKKCILYIHTMRQPISISTAQGIVNDYNCDFYDEIDLNYHAQKWNVSLNF